MEVHFRPETESRLAELASKSGRAPADLVEDALAGYLTEVAEVREMLDGRYNEIKSGRVKPIDGETFFHNLRRRENELHKVWREAMEDKTPGVPVKQVLERLERKYQDLANKVR
jgi:predicted DNA-binding protein